MNRLPTVSVVIPLYNKANHIARAVGSVLAQTYEDFELIIVDDGSTDASREFVGRIIDPRVCLISQKNAGVSAARNRGVAAAKTDLIAFLDADDEWLEDFLHTVLDLHKQFPEAALWGTAYAMRDFDGRLIPVKIDGGIKRQTSGTLINFFRAAVPEQPIHPSSMMVRRDALVKAGGFAENLVRLEDTDMLLRMALRYPVAYCPLVKAVYHMEADNRSDVWQYTGNFPFFENARAFVAEAACCTELGEDVKSYLAYRHTRSLSRNWLTGNHAAMQEIIRDCGRIKGYRLICFGWRLLACIPCAVVLSAMKFKAGLARLAGLSGTMPKVRSIYRSDKGA
jgi:glycosyltransferase involved in cell wall biosynthesis